jgi:hypothetical protein
MMKAKITITTISIVALGGIFFDEIDIGKIIKKYCFKLYGKKDKLQGKNY